MPVAFGFAVGGFIAGINILIDAVKSLNDTYRARADYQERGRELSNLTNALNGIQSLSLDPVQTNQIAAVNAAVNDCRLCVDKFVRRNSTFKSLESIPGKRWSLETFQQPKFRSEVRQQSDAIQMLLITLHVKQIDDQGRLRAKSEQRTVNHTTLTENIGATVNDLSIDHRRMEETLLDQHSIIKDIHLDTQGIIGREASLMQRIQGHSEEIRNHMKSFSKQQEQSVGAQDESLLRIQTSCQEIRHQAETLEALERMMAAGETQHQRQIIQLLHQGIQNQQTLLAQVQHLTTKIAEYQTIPPQVLLSSPVVLLDALGRSAPFHIEFIDSAEAFIAVLKVRFKDVGLHKIERGQFDLEDTKRKARLQLSKPWATIVRPGQHVSMSMVFQLDEQPTKKCPVCGKENKGSETDNIECGDISCRITYRRTVIEDINTASEHSEPSSSTADELLCEINTKHESIQDNMSNYARVHILIPTPSLYCPMSQETLPLNHVDHFTGFSEQKELPLSMPLSTAEMASQHDYIDVAQTLHNPLTSTSSCPRCGKENKDYDTEITDCDNFTCQMTYPTIVENERPSGQEMPNVRNQVAGPSSTTTGVQRSAVNPRDGLTEDEIRIYTQFAIMAQENGGGDLVDRDPETRVSETRSNTGSWVTTLGSERSSPTAFEFPASNARGLSCDRDGCDAIFIGSSASKNLRRHQLTAKLHNKTKYLNCCPGCNKSFSRRDNLRVHFDLRHGPSSRFTMQRGVAAN